MSHKIDRRKFLSSGVQAAGAFAVIGASVPKTLASICGPTPAQTSGPFYPGESNFKYDQDLTWISGHSAKAEGKIIYIQGKILDMSCKPLAGASVEIWQACASGRYNNAKDTNPAAIDPNFKYWGETLTNESGEYSFKTILPGAYPADTDWVRPPHIHFKVAKLGYNDLVTQLYFKGDPLNEKDLILQNIPVAERARVVVDFQPTKSGFELGSLIGNFDITLVSVR